MSQICLVTGASRGIGKAIALELATQGHTVIGTGTSPASAENVTTDLRAARAQGRGAVLDVNDLQQIESVVNEITDEFGPISVLVNNAGVTEDNLLMRMKPSQWEKTLNTNLAAVFALTKLCLKGTVSYTHLTLPTIYSV